MIIYKNNILKNVAYTVYFSIQNGDVPTTGVASFTHKISKDGGAMADTTNTPAEIGNGWYSCALTQSEMNADVILLEFASVSTTRGIAVEIVTVPTELSAAPTLNSSISDKITAIFQYLFFKSTRTSTAINLIKSDNSTTLASSTISDNGTTVTKGAIS